MTRPLSRFIACFAFACAVTPGFAQLSFTSAVGLSLKGNPRVLMAQADVDKARAAIQELRDAYIPNVVGGGDYGPPSYGFPLGQPSIFNLTSQSLVFSYAQRDNLRAARAALEAADLSLKDAREAVAEDTAVTYLALDRDLKRQTALREQQGYAGRLVAIVQERLDAGQDTPIDLTTARLTAAQIRLSLLRAEDETTTDQAHLARLVGLPQQGLDTTGNSIPAFSAPSPELTLPAITTSPAVQSAYASARSKQETAFGESRYLWRPQISFFAQYSRYAEFNNYQDYYLHFQHNNAGVGIAITLPVFDQLHKAKAREAAADAAHALHEADMVRDQFFDDQMRARHTAAELAARAEVADLDQQLAQQQLDVLLVQLKSGTGNLSGPQMSPKDEQNFRIAERDKFLAVLNAKFQAAQAQIDLLRHSGDLESWIASAAHLEALPTVKP
jgi:outer membrane protein TolC